MMLLSDLLTPANIASAVMILNIWTFMLFGIDKMKAESRSWRVAESTLLGLAFIGGSLGAYVGRALFRHKTRKQPFSGSLHPIVIFQVVVAIGGGWFLAGP